MQYYHPEPTPQDTYYLAILIPQSAFKQTELDKHYILPLLNQGFTKQEIVVFPLAQGDKGKVTAALMKEYLVELLTWLKAFDIKLLYVADASYFKHLTKLSKLTQQIGYVLPCIAKDYSPYFAVYGVNYRRLFTEPKLNDVLARSLTVLSDWKQGKYAIPGASIIKQAEYPYSMDAIHATLQSLMYYPKLVADIETTSLKFYEAELASISFCYAEGCGTAFTIGRDHTKEEQHQIQGWLKDFFMAYDGSVIWHNANYDVKILVYRLFMQSEQDQKGLLCGLDWLTRHWHDTKIISYLATNTTTENSLSLKDLAQSYAGDYGALEDGSIANLSTNDLLEYNLKDTLATWWVYHTYYPVMQQDKQEELYKNLLLPTAKVIVQMELTGMPINPVTVEATCTALQTKEKDLAALIAQHTLVQSFTLVLRQQVSAKQHLKWKVKQEPLSYFDYVVFNPKSDDQLRELLYPYLGLPVIDTTDSGLPSTAGETLKKLRNHTDDLQVKELLQAFIDYLAVNKINSTFVPILQNAPLKADGRQYVHGSFNIGGTKSGRLSCVAEHTPIVTSEGLKPISEVVIGDLVWSHKKRWCEVTNTIYKGIDHMYNVHLYNGEILTCTTEHKVLLADNTWQTLGAILDVSFQNLDPQSREYRSSSSVIQKHIQRLNYGEDCKTTSINSPQHIRGIKKQLNSPRTYRNESRKILSIQIRRSKSYEGQISGKASKMGGGMRGRIWLSNYTVQRKERVRTSSSNDGTLASNAATPRYDNSPYRRRSSEQFNRQFGAVHKCGTQAYPLLAGRGQHRVEIEKIEYSGCAAVYDLTVNSDSSYLACGIYSHNSSNPNLQNLPSGKAYGKAIKEVFTAPKGKIMVGADFSGLEDMISALLTKDPNKIKVYTDGYNSHCLRSFSYYRDQMPDIEDTVDSINSIETKYPKLRQASKGVSFACQYFGTYRTLMANLGLSEEQAKAIEANYHSLYQVSDQWSQDRFAEASRQGYIELAFGLRLRTPLMAQTLLGKRSTPFQAAAESRTVGNAVGGQSYGLLNNRAMVEFMQRVWVSPYRYRIQPICMIHDAIYLLIEDSMECVLWVNHHLIDCMKWQELPEIQHPTVKLGAKLELYPTWAKPIQIPNHATAQQVQDLIQQYKNPKPKS